MVWLPTVQAYRWVMPSQASLDPERSIFPVSAGLGLNKESGAGGGGVCDGKQC